MVKDLVFGLPGLESLVETTVSGSETGNAINHQGFVAVKHVIMSGAVGTDIIVKLQVSADGSTGWTDVVEAELVGADTGVNTVTFAATGGDNVVRQLGYLGGIQYSRVNVVSGAGSLVAIAIQEQNLQTAAANS